MIVQEGSAKIKVDDRLKISRELEVFYNPVMKFNRDVSVLLLNAVENKNMQICDLLAGTGVRSIRFLKELDKNKIKNITINDNDGNFTENIKYNLKMSGIDLSKHQNTVQILNEDANRVLIHSTGFDYIDIDPFGSPNPFLENSIARLSREGILAVTATDTSALAGSHEKACIRKYWAKPINNELMHEIGLRILIRKIQLIGSHYEKALIPIFSYSKEHYMRIFFRCEKSKEKINDLFKEHKYFLYCKKCMNRKVSEHNMEKCICKNDFNYYGKIWAGKLNDEKLIEKMIKLCKDTGVRFFLTTILLETKINTIGFYDIHKICENYKLKMVPKTEDIMKIIKENGFKVSRTHFSNTSIRSNIEINRLIKLIQ